MLLTGIEQHDYPVIQGVLFVSTLVRAGRSASSPTSRSASSIRGCARASRATDERVVPHDATPSPSSADAARRRAVAARRPSSIGLVLVGVVVVTALVSLFWLPFAAVRHQRRPARGSRRRAPARHRQARPRPAHPADDRRAHRARGRCRRRRCSAAVIGISRRAARRRSPRRWLDDTVSAMLDILIAFPSLLLAMLVVAAQGARSARRSSRSAWRCRRSSPGSPGSSPSGCCRSSS